MISSRFYSGNDDRKLKELGCLHVKNFTHWNHPVDKKINNLVNPVGRVTSDIVNLTGFLVLLKTGVYSKLHSYMNTDRKLEQIKKSCEMNRHTPPKSIVSLYYIELIILQRNIQYIIAICRSK
jgi:hypothetical protein